MPDFRSTTVEWEGDKALLIVLERADSHITRLRRELPAMLARHSEALIRIYAPGGAISGIAAATDRTSTFFHPGGAGGGGVYEAQAGVTRVPTVHGPSLYPLYVHEGTANKGRGFIYPRDDRPPASVASTGKPRRRTGVTGAALAFMYGGKLIFRSKVEGQKPHPFVYQAFKQTGVYARLQLHSLGREIFLG